MIILAILLSLSLGVNFWLIVDTQIIKKEELFRLKNRIRLCREAHELKNNRLFLPPCVWIETDNEKSKKE